ncbi:basic proline-rich protein-like [Piliocolobus tephrosceles]|uniref:basic proline-rich protein-like n=1 Tax=Piliocolobus tephrosceles TaxID=591936 RepID=UPI000C2AF31A|nr:basic proline-rich protein-like [Piliocolobus tephrosceles]
MAHSLDCRGPPTGLGVHRLILRPETPPCPASPDRAPLSCRPLPAGPAAGPGSPGSRGRRSRKGRPVGRPRSPALDTAPPTAGAAGPRQHKRKGDPASDALASPRDPLRGVDKASGRPRSSGCRRERPHENLKTPPGGCRGGQVSPAPGAPGCTVAQRAAPAWTGLSAPLPPPSPARASPNPRARAAPDAVAPTSAPRGSGRAKHLPPPGCAPRGPAPSPINGML